MEERLNAESDGIAIDRGDGRLTVSVRTHRSGDLVHYVFASIAVVFGAVVLWIGLAKGTLFGSWINLPLVAACLGYGWFALTRRINRRVLVLDAERLLITEGPLFTIGAAFAVPAATVGKITVRKERRWTPPVWWHEVFHVEATGSPDALFRNVSLEADANRISAALVAVLSRL